MVTDTRQRLVGNLPAEATSFVGRRRDVAEVGRLLATARLVTLTGVGGVGKSRLALRVASRRQRAFPDGVWLVELAAVGDPDLVAHTVAEALQLGEQSGRDPLAILVDFLRDRALLLVLDNCEHLTEACAVLADTVLRAAPDVKILATSRQSLGIIGEYVWPLAPLPVPDPELPLPAGQWLRFAAVALFAERAAAARPGFAVTPENQRDVARICQRLDGIPLGIELAAAWTASLPVPEIAARLDDRLAQPGGGGPPAPGRHQTLRAAVQWSYDLCSPVERLLWARASVFAGGLELGSLRAVCAGGALAADVVPAALGGLVDKSVLLRAANGGTARFRLLETLREFGIERLRETGEEDQLRRRHRDHFRRLAQECDASWYGPDQLDWYRRLHTEHANLRAALEYCLTRPGETRAGLEMATALWFYWIACGQLREGRHWLDRALAQNLAPNRERADALAVNGYVTVLQADLPAGEAMLEEGRALARRVGDGRALARATMALGVAAFHAGDAARATELSGAALAGFEALPGGDPMEPVARLNWALLHAMGAGPEQGVELCRQLCRVGEANGDFWMTTWAHFGLAHATWLLGRHQEAARHGRLALRGKWRFQDALGIVVTTELLAWIAASAGEYERAAVTLGAARQTFRLLGLPVFASAHFAEPQRACEAKARRALGDAAFDAAFRHGSALTLDQAREYALGGGPAAAPAAAAPAATSGPAAGPAVGSAVGPAVGSAVGPAVGSAVGPAVGSAIGPAVAGPVAAGREPALTARERQIAELIAEGLSNRQIAARLVIAQRTAESHIEHILAKLGFTSRAQIATWITESKPR